MSARAITLDDVKRRQAARDAGLPLSSSWAAIHAVQQGRPAVVAVNGVRTFGDPPIARREGDTLWLSLAVAPRTKKNHGRTVVTPSAAYARFAYHVRELLRPMVGALGLPLPEQDYNCAALFHVDNDRADTVGLMQALADALEPDAKSDFAGVITNDRQLRTWNGTDQTLATLRPHITLTLTPCEGR